MKKLLATAAFVIASQIIFMPYVSANGFQELNKKNSLHIKCAREAGSRTGQERSDFIDNCSGVKKPDPSSYGKGTKMTPQQRENLMKALEARKAKMGNN